jgi:predicted  nucleic acid-binding Zn-ribbon protein
MSDIQRDVERVERSLSNLSSHLRYVMTDRTDVRPKLYGLDENVDKLEKDVRKIRKKLEFRQIS